MLGIILWNLLVFATGAICVVVSTWWWIVNQDIPDPEPKKLPVTESSLPEELVDKLKQQGDAFHRRETCLSLNLILQFFFQEKRFEAGIMRWFTNMLTLEFSDLLKHKALSKFIHNMQIRDLNLGNNFPVIRAVTAKQVNLNPDSAMLEQVDIMVEVEYNGGIQLAVDASSRLSKAAMVKIKVVHLSGNGRLQFSRHPFTHWSFSFYDEPQVEFEVYSSLGLHIPRFNSIIISQLRGILKRKHTLPYFKLRGPPLIKRPTQSSNEEGCSVPPGRLTGSVVKCSRLNTSLVGEVMYCTVILSEVPVVCAVEKPSGLWVIQDITLKRPHGTSAGILLRHADEGTQMIESVQQNSPAQAAGLRKNDVLVAVNGTYLNSGQQAAKLFSTSNINGDNNSITLRVKRLIQLEQRKVVAEQRIVGPDGSGAVIGEDTSGRLPVACSGQANVAAYITNCSCSGNKCSNALVDTSTSSASGCIGASDGTASHGGGNVPCCSVGDASSTGSQYGRSGTETPLKVVPSTGSASSSTGGCGASKGGETGGSIGSCGGGIGGGVGDDNGMAGGARAVSPSHLLAGLMGTFNGGRPSRHRSLPGSPVLQRTSRNRINSTREGDISGSGKSTPDSSHNSSPELKRKLLDLHSFPTDTRLNSTQDKSPISSSSSKSVQRPINQDKSNVNTQSPTHQASEKPPSNQSSKAGTPTSPEIMLALNAEKRGVRRHTGKNKMLLKILQTPFVDGSCDPVFDSDFEFWLEDENKYMSIAVWSRNISSAKLDDSSSEKKDIKDKSRAKDTSERDRRRSRDGDKWKQDDVTAGLSDDTLVGFMNLALISLIPDTTLTTQGHVTRVITLNPPHPRCPEVIGDPLTPHKGFNTSLCYGDVMLSLTYQPQDRCEVLGRTGSALDKSALSEDESVTDGTISEEEDIFSTDGVEDRNHDFKRTHFNSATQCDFCKKKIWLKDAYQCCECGIICHKKCMVRCEQETSCSVTATTLRYRDSPRTDAKDNPPEIITTAAAGDTTADSHTPGNTPPASPQIRDMASRLSHGFQALLAHCPDLTHPVEVQHSLHPMSNRRTLSSLFAQVASASKGSLKRAGSAHNLALPNPSSGGSQSRSLPPSPPHSPQRSRKVSLSEGANPFVVEWDEGDTIQGALDRLMLLPHDERLVNLARDSAKDLYAHLPHPERINKINMTLAQLQSSIDNEGEVRVDLAKQEREASDSGDSLTRASVSLQISQCDARTQALALLTLHYCTALQCCNSQTQDDSSEVKPKEQDSNPDLKCSNKSDSSKKGEKQTEE